jgi:hypothetical protein
VETKVEALLVGDGVVQRRTSNVVPLKGGGK